MVDDPEAADHGEADREGVEVPVLVEDVVPQLAARGHPMRDLQLKHKQSDRDREDAVAESDDPREFDLVLDPVGIGCAAAYHAPIINAGLDGIEGAARLAPPTMPGPRRRSSAGRALHS